MIWLILAVIAIVWALPPRGDLAQFHRTSENKTNNVYRLPVGKQRVKRRAF